jgi:hypothetical protein
MYVLLLQKVIDKIQISDTLVLTGILYSRIGNSNAKENTGTIPGINNDRGGANLGLYSK